jgi:hypothetical protein
VQSTGKWDFPGIILLKKNPWTKSTDRWTARARCTMDRQPLPRAGAHRSLASGRSTARELRPSGGGGRGKHRGADFGLTGARNVAKRRHDDGVGGGGGALGAGSVRVWRKAKVGRGRSGCRGTLLLGPRGSGAAGRRRGTGGGGGAP